jgi:acyl carrier protein
MDKKIINYIIEELHGGRTDLEISLSDDLLGGGLIESMGMMKLIQYIEEEFDFKVAPEDMLIENFMTVGDMVNYINRSKA